MRVTLFSLLFLMTIFLASCGGGGGADGLTIEDAVGTWRGRFLQAGGIACSDIFIGACAGCELGDATVEVSADSDQFLVVVEHCADNREAGESCTSCSYSGNESTALKIVATSSDESCAEEVTFTLVTAEESELFEQSRPPSGNRCAVNFSASLLRQAG